MPTDSQDASPLEGASSVWRFLSETAARDAVGHYLDMASSDGMGVPGTRDKVGQVLKTIQTFSHTQALPAVRVRTADTVSRAVGRERSWDWWAIVLQHKPTRTLFTFVIAAPDDGPPVQGDLFEPRPLPPAMGTWLTAEVLDGRDPLYLRIGPTEGNLRSAQNDPSLAPALNNLVHALSHDVLRQALVAWEQEQLRASLTATPESEVTIKDAPGLRTQPAAPGAARRRL